MSLDPDPLRPVDTDDPTLAELAWMAATGRRVVRDRPTLPVVPLVIALGVIVGILVAWAVR